MMEMKFIKTVRTNNGNYAVFFQQKSKGYIKTGYVTGVFLNKDGHLIRPMSSKEAEYCWNQWGSDAKSVVPKFHVPFLTIGRELDKFYNSWEFFYKFSTVSEAQKWVKESGYELVRTERYKSIPFMGKTITTYVMSYLDPEDDNPSHLRNGDIVTGFDYFNTIS